MLPDPRFIISALLLLGEGVAAIMLLILLSERMAVFGLIILGIKLLTAAVILNSNDNPEYKAPWLLILLFLPIGFIAYLIFYFPRLHPEDGLPSEVGLSAPMAESEEPPTDTARVIRAASFAGGYRSTEAEYLPSGRAAMQRLIHDIGNAREFIFLEYFIIEEGEFLDAVITALSKKTQHGVKVTVIYDDVGCMRRLPSKFKKQLSKIMVRLVAHFPIFPNKYSKFNNRTHRKIAVIDGRIGYVGGVNISDECIGKWGRGVFKDSAVRIEGNAVNELSYLFLSNLCLNLGRGVCDFNSYYRYSPPSEAAGYTIPFGDGPRPIYKRRVSKSAILTLIGEARRYLYITTPYLVMESDIFTALENAVMRGVDVRIILPAIPDKRLVYLLTKSSSERLIEGGVRVFLYLPGFIHSKIYLADGEAVITGSMNLDYRSLAHNFENGIYFYKHPVIKEIEDDVRGVLADCEQISKKEGLRPTQRLVSALIKILAPLF